MMNRQDDLTSSTAEHTRKRSGSAWTCWNCGKPMGALYKNKVHLHPPKSHAYVAPYPVRARCCRCGSNNLVACSR
jgi:hypothetical protein